MPEQYPLPSSNPAALGFAAKPLEHLDRLIREHIEQGRYPGAQIALARNGQLALFRTYGDARTEGGRRRATDDTLFLLFSQTKVLTSAAVWTLVEEGRLSFMDKDQRPSAGIRRTRQRRHHAAPGHDAPGRLSVRRCQPRKLGRSCADARRGLRLLARLDPWHEAAIPPARRASDAGDGHRGGDRARLSRRDPRQRAGAARARQRCVRRRAVRISKSAAPTPTRRRGATTRPSSRPAGLPSGGGYATARGMAAFYQMLLGQGRLGDVRLLVAAARRLCDEQPYRRPRRRRDGRHPDASRSRPACARRERPHPRPRHDRRAGRPSAMAAPVRRIPGPTRPAACRSPISPTYVQPDPWHSARLDRVANLVHAAID